MAYFYTYVDPEELDKVYLEESGKEEDEDDGVKKQKSNEIALTKVGKTTRLWVEDGAARRSRRHKY